MKNKILKVFMLGIFAVSLIACSHTEDTILTQEKQIEQQENEMKLTSETVPSEEIQKEDGKIKENGKEVQEKPISSIEVK